MNSYSCTKCQTIKTISSLAFQRNCKRNGGDFVCVNCKFKTRKLPQNTKEFWASAEKKEQHSQKMKSSESYYESLLTRNISGDRNGMFGKHLSEESRRKMSISRTGKTGPSATAWKGGKSSLNKRVKGFIHRQCDWYKKVYVRDNWTCQHCQSKKNLDAHHIIPICTLIKEIVSGKNELTDIEKYNIIISDPRIIDADLSNGITLCRSCHRKEHKLWGSRNNP